MRGERRRWMCAGLALFACCTFFVWRLDDASASAWLVQSNATLNGAAATSVSCTLNAAATAGDLLVVSVTSAALGEVWNTPSGWSVGKVQEGDSSQPMVGIWYKVAAGGETSQSVTTNPGSQPAAMSCMFYEFGNVGASPTVHGTAGVSGSSGTTCTTGSLSTAPSAGDLLMVSLVSSSGTKPSATANFDGVFASVAGASGPAAVAGFKVAEGSEAGPTWGWTTSSGYSCAAVSITPGTPATTTTTAATTTTTAATTTTTAVTTTTTGGSSIDYARFCTGILAPGSTTTGTASTTTTTGCAVVLSGFSGDGLALMVGMGLVVFAALFLVVVSWRQRRA